MSSPTVAICIPTYNQAAYLDQSVASAFAQTYPNVEVWVSDDASTDTTPEVAQSLLERFPALRYHRQERNLGISANNNWLLAQPKAEFIVRLDSDDLLHPNYVETLIALLVRYPSAGFAHGDVCEIGAQGEKRRIRRLGNRSEYQEPEEALRATVLGYRVAANICMFRKAALIQAQFYNSHLHFAEDWDLSVRLADAGWGNAHSAEVLSSYRCWGDAAGVRARRKISEMEGCLWVFEKSLAPAFERRQWDASALHTQRVKLAKQHVIALDSPVFSAQERQDLWSALQKLGDSPSLRRQARLIGLRLGFLLRLQAQANVKARDFAKGLLRRVRRIR